MSWRTTLRCWERCRAQGGWWWLRGKLRATVTRVGGLMYNIRPREFKLSRPNPATLPHCPSVSGHSLQLIPTRRQATDSEQPSANILCIFVHFLQPVVVQDEQDAHSTVCRRLHSSHENFQIRTMTRLASADKSTAATGDAVT